MYNNKWIENTLDVCIWELEIANHSVNFLSTTAEKIFGISKEQLLNKPYPWSNFIHPDDLPSVENNQKKLNRGLSIQHEYQIIDSKGEIHKLMTHIFPRMNNLGQITHHIGAAVDLSNKRRSELQLKSTMKQLADITLALDQTAEVTITDTKGIITYANDKFCQLSKYSREELIGQDHRIIKSGYHSPEVYQELWETISQGEIWHNEIKNKAKDGSFYWADSTIVPFLNEQGVPYQYIAIRKDITEKKKSEEIIRKLAYEDILTNLPNRRSLEIELEKTCHNQEEKFAVLLIGLDDFKLINDHYGFKTGNKVLIEISKRLVNIMKNQKSFISHISGDEFVILLKGINHIDEAIQLAENILQTVNKPLHIKDNLLYITTSIGISSFPNDEDENATLVEKADIALNEGKLKGKNQYHLFTNLMDVESFKKFHLQNDIRQAMENEEFFIVYQPKIETSSHQVIGAEALVRWEHSKWGTVPPYEFISIAEKSGVIIKLGEWILRNVCEQIKEWNRKGLRQVPIAVNFSPIQFSDEKMTDTVLQILDDTGINPKWLEIEITENVILDNNDDVMKKMMILKNRGISFSIDDFGTGYSSLKTLNQLPFDLLKIDRSFIKDLHYNEGSLKITKTIIQLAHLLDLKVIAEGVDDTKQLSILNEQNCDYIQGYLFSKPIHPIEFEKSLRNQKISQTSEQKTNQSFVNKRKYFRISFIYPLLGTITVQYLNNRHVNIGRSSILIGNIGPGGLCYESQIKFPLNKDFVLGIATKILDHSLSFQGRNVWCNEVDNGLYQYGFEFTMEESERADLVKLLNQLQVKYKKELLLPDCNFIQIKNKANFFHKN